jgi:hypothetical protein
VTALLTNGGQGCQITARDAQVIRWLGEQFGARLDTLSVLLARHSPDQSRGAGQPLSLRSVRAQLGRWERQGLVTVARALGATWVTPTTKGLGIAGLPYKPWRMPVTQLRHVHAVGVVRLGYELVRSPDPSTMSTWICERQIWLERGKSTATHVPDGKALIGPTVGKDEGPERTAWFEVELTRKTRARLEQIFSLPAADREGVYYFCPEHLVEPIRSDLESVIVKIGKSIPFQVRSLPTIDGVSLGGRW